MWEYEFGITIFRPPMRMRVGTESLVFFRLPGRILWGMEKVEVELKRCNDCALNRDLETLCARVVQKQPRLPDGCRLLFRVQSTGILHLDAQEKEVE